MSKTTRKRIFKTPFLFIPLQLARRTRILLKSYNGLCQKIMDIELSFAAFKQEIMAQKATCFFNKKGSKEGM